MLLSPPIDLSAMLVKSCPRISPLFTGMRYYSQIRQVPLWIGGKQVTSTSRGTTIHKHPRTGQKSCEVVIAGELETREAIRHSREAYKSWGMVSGWERRSVLQNALRLLKERSANTASLLRADADFSDLLVHSDIDSSINLLDGSAETAISIEGYMPQTIDGSLAMVMKEPHGPVFSIPAFNFPLTLAMRSIVYPLACGNTVVMKASPLVPQLSTFIAALFNDAGLPPGVLQILSFSEDEVGKRVEQLIAHDDIRFVNFTGSISLGKQLASLCGQYLKPSVMELGGKAPAIVLPSANLQLAANHILFGAFLNSGQVCMSMERVIVHEEIAEEFEQVLKSEAIKAGWVGGMELVRSGAGERARNMVDQAVKMGARVIYSAGADSSATSLSSESAFPPTILADVHHDADLFQVESFAPILTIQSGSDLPSIIAMTNSHETGLSASVFCQNLALALKVARSLQSGAVHINGMSVHDQHGLPHGGTKNSGWSRFNGKGAIESFTQTKVIRINGTNPSLPLSALYRGLPENDYSNI
ncbi:aldehyde dehydrogenase [Cryptococcus neoformans Bt120]|nr:aldehyde dehydrogenase [Cryptococcus neoformans var. grubii Bt15]OXG38267.1 aldehyde dehydrogenase [Cryptococcus neoformans var. grubii Bt120]